VVTVGACATATIGSKATAMVAAPTRNLEEVRMG